MPKVLCQLSGCILNTRRLYLHLKGGSVERDEDSKMFPPTRFIRLRAVHSKSGSSYQVKVLYNRFQPSSLLMFNPCLVIKYSFVLDVGVSDISGDDQRKITCVFLSFVHHFLDIPS